MVNSEAKPMPPERPTPVIEASVRLASIAILAFCCFQVLAPFIPLMLWGMILAVGCYPVHQKLAGSLSGNQGRAATIIALIGCLILIAPMVLLASSAVDRAQDVQTKLHNNELILQPPSSQVAEFPVVGKRLYKLWSEASANSKGFIISHKEQAQLLSKKALAAAKSGFSSVGFFIAALIVAGVMMSWGESGTDAVGRVFSRLSGPENGPKLQKLAVATIRSVANGVVGLALAQGLLLGLGFMAAGIPFPALLALLIILISIMQLPALILTIPVIAYMWSVDGSTLHHVFFTIFFLIGGLADGLLKPVLLGRGVDAPMPVVLIGALGGMVSNGIIGLFLGATLLALGYTLFMEWVDDGSSPDAV